MASLDVLSEHTTKVVGSCPQLTYWEEREVFPERVGPSKGDFLEALVGMVERVTMRLA